jgi:hypothetical protein
MNGINTLLKYQNPKYMSSTVLWKGDIRGFANVLTVRANVWSKLAMFTDCSSQRVIHGNCGVAVSMEGGECGVSRLKVNAFKSVS